MNFLFDILYFFIVMGLVFWLAIFVGGMVLSWFVRRRIKKFQRQFTDSDATFTSARSPHNSSRTTHTADGITIEDHRSPAEAQKKIFTQDEGEYVDFTENN